MFIAGSSHYFPFIYLQVRHNALRLDFVDLLECLQVLFNRPYLYSTVTTPAGQNVALLYCVQGSNPATMGLSHLENGFLLSS